MRTPHIIAGLLSTALLLPMAHAQAVSISFTVNVEPAASSRQRSMPAMPMPPAGSDAVVAWLSPNSTPDTLPHPPAPPHSYILTQKDKQFSPHLLVVPTGSRVEFPNLDPFFHNVFSLFNGRRFDLGLYEAGSRRSVLFDHDGVSYIFCNIHPEMGAVIVSLSTPYYAVSAADGTIILSGVPPGEYELNLWSQNVSTADSAALRQKIHVSNTDLHLPLVTLKRTNSPLAQHLNKFGEAYKKTDQAPY